MLVRPAPQRQEQGELDLFAGSHEPEPPRRDSARLMGALDALNRRFGRGAVAVVSAARSTSAGGVSARQERRSPRYTTRLDEIPSAKA